MSEQDTRKTSLLDLLRNTPEDARGEYEHNPTSHSFIPYGRHAKEAVTLIESQAKRIAELEAELAAEKARSDLFYGGTSSEPDTKGTAR